MTADHTTSVDESAEKLLSSHHLMEEALASAERRGVMGEESNKQMLLLACVGGLLADPIHCVIHGASSSGKNTLVRSITDLLPRDRLLHLSGMSDLAFFYSDEDIEGVVVFDEAGGLSGYAAYTMRQAMSEGSVRRLTVNKGKGGRNEPQMLETKVTASVITTTTSTALHPENQTRVFDLWTDESEALTQRINRALGRRQASGGHSAEHMRDLEVWRGALAELEALEVVTPYAESLAELFPSDPIRSRRDLPRVLALIRAHALLFQKQRQRTSNNELVAELADYEAVYPLLQRVLAHTMTGLTESALEIDSALQRMAGKNREWVRRRDLERHLKESGGPSPNTVRKWASHFMEHGYWEGRRNGGAWEYRPVRDAASEPIALPRPEELTTDTRGYQTDAGVRIGISENGLSQPTKDTSSLREQAIGVTITDRVSSNREDREEEGIGSSIKGEEPTSGRLGGTGRTGRG